VFGRQWDDKSEGNCIWLPAYGQEQESGVLWPTGARPGQQDCIEKYNLYNNQYNTYLEKKKNLFTFL